MRSNLHSIAVILPRLQERSLHEACSARPMSADRPASFQPYPIVAASPTAACESRPPAGKLDKHLNNVVLHQLGPTNPPSP
jgi:hypothetical protein